MIGLVARSTGGELPFYSIRRLQAVWGLPFYTPLFCLTKLVSIGFYASLMGATRFLARAALPSQTARAAVWPTASTWRCLCAQDDRCTPKPLTLNLSMLSAGAAAGSAREARRSQPGSSPRLLDRPLDRILDRPLDMILDRLLGAPVKHGGHSLAAAPGLQCREPAMHAPAAHALTACAAVRQVTEPKLYTAESARPFKRTPILDE